MGRYLEQTTIARPVTMRGTGLHTGGQCAVSLQPAGPGAGIVFATESGALIPASADHVIETERGTSLGAGGESVGCVEHLMAALYGLGVDNVRVEITGPEVPACDGSAREWVELVEEARIAPLGAAKPLGEFKAPIWAGDGAGAVIAVPGSRGLRLAVSVDYEGTVARHQSLWIRLTPRRFARWLAPARTFVMEGELEALRQAGLAKGGSGANAFVAGPGGYSGPLRFEDEVVRHKALDLVGDLALCGWRFEGVVVALRPSHRRNVALAGALRAQFLGAAAREEAVRRR